MAEAFAALRADWDAYLGTLSVSTPDTETNATVNYLAPMQCRTTLYWSRFVSGYETGLGGHRKRATRPRTPSASSTPHPGRPPPASCTAGGCSSATATPRTSTSPSPTRAGREPRPSGQTGPEWFSDDHLWLVLATCNYLKETGDYRFLDRRVRYVTEPTGEAEPAVARSSGVDDTVWGHMMAAIGFTLAHLGPHGLPRWGTRTGTTR